jgi:hypothetical protein
MECPNAQHCPLFAQFKLRPALNMWMAQFCAVDDHCKCQRYRRKNRGELVPARLLPNGKLLP